LHIVPDWEGGQHSVALSREQHTPRGGFDFHSADWSMSEKDAAEDSAPSSCK
jgi:hypothetical protein